MDQKKLYNSTIPCPVCSQPFEATKVRRGSYRATGQDSDFAAHYEGLNPIFYAVFVCPHCGYAALQNSFANVGPKEKLIITQKITPHWKPKNYGGERTLDSALDTFKLALYVLQLCNAKSSEIAAICIRIAWIYRWKGDPRETEFLKYALEYYCEAYQTEDLPIGKLDGPHCIYLIAELHRKTGNIEEATQWFSRLFASPEARQDHRLMDMARDQYQLIKDLKQNP